MAIVNLDDTKISAKVNVPAVGALTASTTDGLEYTVKTADEKTCLIVYNSSDDTAYDITIKQPANPTVGGANADKVVEIAAGKVAVIEVESAKYMDAVSKKITFDSENIALTAVVVEFYN